MPTAKTLRPLLLAILSTLTLASLACSTTPGEEDDNHALTATPSEIDFGYIAPLGYSENVEVLLTNGTAGQVKIQVIRIGEDSDSGFNTYSVPAQLPTNLGPGQTETISVYFAPPSTGTFYGTLEIETDADTDGPLEILLGGCSTDPDCSVDVGTDDGSGDGGGDDDDNTTSGDIAVSSASLDFGTVPQNQSESMTLLISNTGSGALTIQNPTIESTAGDEGLFAVFGYPGGSLDPGANDIELTVTFSAGASALGTKSATLKILSDDPDEGSLSIPLSSEVTQDCGDCLPRLTIVNAVPMEFFSDVLYLQVGTGTQSVQVQNSGFGTLTVNSISEGGELPIIAGMPLIQVPDSAVIEYQSGAPLSLEAGVTGELTFHVGGDACEVINFDGEFAFAMGTDASSTSCLGLDGFDLPGMPSMPF